ncbi:MAG: HlyD family efflux transporter periplasmic adaptor subunit [Pseudomonadota bacterium]
MNSEKLFREEVLLARQAQWLGSIRIGQPLRFAVVTGVSVLLATALIGYGLWGEIARKARLPGFLEPVGGILNITTPQQGIVGSVLVREGDWVKAGQALVLLRSERSIAGGDAAALNQRYLDQRRSTLLTERLLARQQRQQRADALRDRIRSLDAELRQVLAERENIQVRAGLAEKTLERFRALAKDGFVSQSQVQQREEDLLDVQLRQRSAERNLEALQRDRRGLVAELEENRSATLAADSQFDRSLAALSQEAAENEVRGGVTVTAPRAGRVSAITQAAGQSVQAGQTLLTVAAAADGTLDARQELTAYLFAPSRTAGFVREGQTVWIRYAAYPYQKFGMAEGVTVAVSRTPLAPHDLPSAQAQALLDAAHANEPLYRIQVRLLKQTISTYGREQTLKAGMALEADVIQDRRAIWEWLLEPVLAVARKSA